MNGITHKQAKRFMRADLDGLLTGSQRRDLETHLAGCEACRAETQSLSALTSRLQSEFHSRWDAQDGPSENVLAKIQSQSRRIIIQKRIDFVFNLLGRAVALFVLFLLVTSVISKFQKSSTASNGTQTPASATQPGEGLIAFVLVEESGDREIYTMKPDGSELTNITDNPATDESPAWSPDGKQIAFTSDQSGSVDIYIMNADGSNVRRLTDYSGFDGYFLWSPDGQKIVYISSENSLNEIGQLIVMNADGSNKIILAEQGSYTILGWSPDGQKIVYEIANLENNRETRIMVARDDGTSTHDGPFFEGDGGRRHYQIHWESSEQFITLSVNSKQPTTWGLWNLTRFYTAGDYTNYNGSNPILLTSDFPIVAIFETTYVVEDNDSLNWFTYSGTPIPLAPWSFSQVCKTPTDPLLEETTHTISPDKQRDFVSLHCPEGITYFFLTNSDGTEIQQLGTPITDPLQATSPVWSPDGKHIVLILENPNDENLYRFDLEEGSSAGPVPLTTDGAIKHEAVWQPQP